MGLNGINGSNPTQPTNPTTLGTQSGPTVGTQTGTTEATEDNVPVLGTTEETPTGDGSIPSPDDPEAYAEHLAQTSNDYEDLMALREQLQVLADHGDAKAVELMAKIDAAIKSMGLGNERAVEKFEEELDQYADYLPDADYDGDGISNADDLDDDNDTLTDVIEKTVYHSDSMNADSDNDKIVDWAEVAIATDGRTSLKELDGYQNTDINNGDVDGNGVLDGDQLSGSIYAKYVGGGTGSGTVGGSGGTGGTDGTGGTEGVGSQAENLPWPVAGSDAQTVDGATGGTIDGDTDVVFNASGDLDVSLSADGKDLIITQGGVTTTIKKYEDRKIWVNGTAENVTFHDMSASVLSPTDSNNDGVADSGVKWGTGVKIASSSNSYDPFNGSLPVNDGLSTDDTTVYNAAGTAGTFTVPSVVDGEEVTSVIVTKGDFDGDGIEDVIVELKGAPEGPTLRKFVLRGAVADVENAVSGSGISFKLDDKGQYFYSEDVKVHVVGGKGDDYITGKAGSFIEGGDGSDVLRLTGTEGGGKIDGGTGDDYIEGSDGGNEMLSGGPGEGMDLIMANAGANDTLDGGDGDDILVDTDGGDTIIGGGGQDMSNDVSGSATGVEVDVTLNSFMDYLNESTNEAAGALLEELGKAGDLTNEAKEVAAEAIANATSSLLSHKKSERYNSYGGTHDSDIPEPEEEPAGP